MSRGDGARLLAALARRWHRRLRLVAALRVVACVLPPLAAALALDAADRPGWSVVALLGAVAAAAIGWWRWHPRSITLETIARHLDRTLGVLDDSAELLLRRAEELPLVARLQREKVVAAAGEVEERAELPIESVRRAARWAGGSLVVALLIPWLVTAAGRGGGAAGEPSPPVAVLPLGADAEVVAVRVTVEPPAYTRRPVRAVDRLKLTAVEGAAVRWRIEVREPPGAAPTTLELVFDESERMPLVRGGRSRDRVAYTAERKADESHLYRLEWSSPSGEPGYGPVARFEVVPDRSPVVEIESPEAFVELEPDGERWLDVAVTVEDDYGVGDAWLVATIASGFGELVEFRERRLEFDRRRSELAGIDGEAVMRFSSRLDLDRLGLEPGAELYLFAEGEDRRPPTPNRARSATHIVRLPGERARSVGLAARLPILRVPEFFRSQRQIILDTEKLLEDEPSITREELVRRSEALGFDQRALRMRYGGLLGEEFESGRPAGIDSGEEDHAERARRLEDLDPERSDAEIEEAFEALPEGAVHEHDSAEIATYFDSEIKAQLKAALEEMWGAEGSLRSIEPGRALPYEYRALAWLKRVQERSRLYVQKVGFEAPQLYPDEKRLTGELDEVRTVRRVEQAPASRQQEEVRRALAGLDDPDAVERDPLLAAARGAARELAERARRDPALDLSGLEGLRGWITALEEGREASAAVRRTARAALWSLLPPPELAPRRPGDGSTELERRYRRRLLGDGAGGGGA